MSGVAQRLRRECLAGADDTGKDERMEKKQLEMVVRGILLDGMVWDDEQEAKEFNDVIVEPIIDQIYG